MNRFALLVSTVMASALLFGMGPINAKCSGVRASHGGVASQEALSRSEFRCILVGDSQTTTPDPIRIRTQIHRWDMPFYGDLIVTGGASSGYVVNNIGISNLTYRTVNPNTGWNDGGPEEFFAPSASEWVCTDDVLSSGSRFGRYRLGFGTINSDAPYASDWGVGVDLVARIAIRTSPNSIAQVKTRAERGSSVDVAGETVHQLDSKFGVQVIEQFIPASIDPTADLVGVGLYMAAGNVELPDQRLQVLGVTITRAVSPGERPGGFMMAYQGRGGWNIQDHLLRTSNQSRQALAKMTDATHVMIMLGHNREPEGSGAVASRLFMLKGLWEIAFLMEGLPRPTFVYVVPWPLEGALAAEYLGQVNIDMKALADSNPRDVFVSYYDYFGGVPPEKFDPARYMLDSGNVHPGDIPTAVHLSEDLANMLFTW